MSSAAALTAAHDAFARRAWSEAFERFSAQDEAGGLGLEDLEMLATAAVLTGHAPESRQALARGHRQAVDDHQIARASRFAFWLGMGLRLAGESSQAAGWFARARRLLVDHDLDCAERG